MAFQRMLSLAVLTGLTFASPGAFADTILDTPQDTHNAVNNVNNNDSLNADNTVTHSDEMHPGNNIATPTVPAPVTTAPANNDDDSDYVGPADEN